MTIGEKIRGIRTLKGLSQENMAEMLGLSLLSYGDIERGKKDVNMNRLEQIAEKLGVSVSDIMKFGDTVSNFFDQCNGAVGLNNGTQNNNYDQRELQLTIEKQTLEIAKFKAEKEKAEMEAKYWQEKWQAIQN